MIKSSQKKDPFKNIVIFIYDFDGVMTNNKFLLDSKGNEQVNLNRSDGLAVSKIREMGFRQLIFSSEDSTLVSRRAEKLKIESIKGVSDKLEGLKGFLIDNDLDSIQVAYVGNDINDLEAMKIVGLRICPSDAYMPIKDLSDIVLQSKGGEGVIRELYGELIGEKS